MIYHVALAHPSRVVLVEADSFYVDEGMIIFNTEGMDVARRLATFPTNNVLWVAGDGVTTGTTNYPRHDMMPFPIRSDEEREEARQRLMHAPAILSADRRSIHPHIGSSFDDSVDRTTFGDGPVPSPTTFREPQAFPIDPPVQNWREGRVTNTARPAFEASWENPATVTEARSNGYVGSLREVAEAQRWAASAGVPG